MPDALIPASPRWRSAMRFAWRHRMLSATVFLLLYALTLRLVWGAVVNAQLRPQREAIRARGEPVELADIEVIPLPDGENAWLIQLKAAMLNSKTSPSNCDFQYPDYPPFGANWDLAAAKSDKKDAAVFPLVRQARSLSKAQLRTTYQNILSQGTIPYSDARELANTLVDGAVYQHLQGNDMEAIERLMDVLHLAHSLHQDNGLVAQLVAIAHTAIAAERAQVIAGDLRVDSPQTRQRVQALIQMLLDERASILGFQRAMPVERVVTLDFTKTLSEGTWFIHPLDDRSEARANVRFAHYHVASHYNNAEEARKNLRLIDDLEGGTLSFSSQADKNQPRYTRWFMDWNQSLTKTFEQHYCGLGQRRQTAVSLAMQLYRADHAAWPERLDQLVPAYLPALPADPFYADGRPIGYLLLKHALPDGGDRPLLFYDAGETDDVPIDTEPMYGWKMDRREGKNRRVIRQYLDVARWSPKVRRFDAEEAERVKEELRVKEQERLDKIERLKLEKAVDGNPGQPDAPGQQPEKKETSPQPAEK